MIHYYSQIHHSDIEHLYEQLNKVKFGKNSSAVQSGKIDNTDGRSANLGFIWNRTQLKHGGHLRMTLSSLSVKYPDLMVMCAKICRSIDADFDFTTIQINKNCVCMPHLDSSNVGESILVSFGDYTGGQLNIKDRDTITSIDTDLQPIKFNGSKYFHWNNTFEGTKYSIVFYNRSTCSHANAHYRVTNYADILFNPSIEPIEVFYGSCWNH